MTECPVSCCVWSSPGPLPALLCPGAGPQPGLGRWAAGPGAALTSPQADNPGFTQLSTQRCSRPATCDLSVSQPSWSARWSHPGPSVLSTASQESSWRGQCPGPHTREGSAAPQPWLERKPALKWGTRWLSGTWLSSRPGTETQLRGGTFRTGTLMPPACTEAPALALRIPAPSSLIRKLKSTRTAPLWAAEVQPGEKPGPVSKAQTDAGLQEEVPPRSPLSPCSYTRTCESCEREDSALLRGRGSLGRGLPMGVPVPGERQQLLESPAQVSWLPRGGDTRGLLWTTPGQDKTWAQPWRPSGRSLAVPAQCAVWSPPVPRGTCAVCPLSAAP